MLSPPRIVATIILSLLLLTGIATVALIIRASTFSGPGIILIYQLTNPSLSVEQAHEIAKARLEGTRARTTIVEDKRVGVRIPYTPAIHQSTTAFTDALEIFRRAVPTRTALKHAVDYTGKDGDAIIASIAPPGRPLFDALKKLAQARNELDILRRKVMYATAGEIPDDLQKEHTAAAKNLDTAHINFAANFIDEPALLCLLEAAASSNDAALQKQVDDLPARYPAQADALRPILSAWRDWLAAGGTNFLRPDEVDTLLIDGELNFRVAVTPSDLGGIGSPVHAAAIENLQCSTPASMETPTLGFATIWLEMDRHTAHVFESAPVVTAYYFGTPYLLCYNDRFHILTGNNPTVVSNYRLLPVWSVHPGAIASDPRGNVALPFTLDQRGAQDLADLADIFKGQPLAIILGTRALSVATISPAFADHPTIPFGIPTPDHTEVALREHAVRVQHILSGGTKLSLQRLQ